MSAPTAALKVFAPPRITMERRDGGQLLLRSETPLESSGRSIAHVFRARAEQHPTRLLAAQRPAGSVEWTGITYGDARVKADALAQALLNLQLGPDRPLMILSGNSVEHLLMTLAAYTAGVPVIPVSVAYSLMSADHERVRYIAELTDPGAVYADDAGPFAKALDHVAGAWRPVIVARGERGGALRLDALAAVAPDSRVDAALDAVSEDTTAKLLFTSGSTGVPKGVINTHRMLCSNQAALAQIWPFLRDEPPIMVDWLPWSHTFGGNHNMNLAICNGGTLYIDDGKPAPPLFGRTVSALTSMPPTVYFNVPAGYALLAPRLESDPAFAERFFSRLRFMFYAAAALPDALAHRLRAVAAQVADHEVPLTSSWGATETAPCVTSAHFPDAVIGCMGVPLPGVQVKLAPVGDKLELRVAGPNITPGYFADPETTAQAFDAEGFYRTGDAGRLVDAEDPAKGLLFDGRIAEDFKLITGTWVTVGPLRTRLVSTARVLTDAVITGHNGPFVGALAWVNQVEARRVCGAEEDVPLDHPALRAHLQEALRELNAGAGSAARVERLLLLDEPPSLDAGEITDKGYINQRRVLERRAEAVAALHAEPPGPDIITG